MSQVIALSDAHRHLIDRARAAFRADFVYLEQALWDARTLLDGDEIEADEVPSRPVGINAMEEWKPGPPPPPRVPTERACRVCKTTFVTRYENARYCSEECRHEHQYQVKYGKRPDMSDRSCTWCGESFQPTQKHALYCSPRCKARASEHRNRAARNRRRQAAKARRKTADTPGEAPAGGLNT